MPTTSADPASLVVVDTNVLLAATDRSRGSHLAATEFLNEDERRLAITPHIVREYLAVTTRPLGAHGLGVSGQDAVTNVDEFLADIELLAEGPATTRALLGLVGQEAAAGKQVHDANVVAVALAHRAAAIVTDNTRHFARFAHLMVVENLSGGRVA